MVASARKKRPFKLDSRDHYDPDTEGFGHPDQWKAAFNERMGFEEAQRVVRAQSRSPRQILGVGLAATWAEIGKAYRKKVVECHPDRIATTGMTAEEAHEALKRVNAAYSVLAREFGK
jgi:DnaJ-domain-containing protein 1